MNTCKKISVRRVSLLASLFLAVSPLLAATGSRIPALSDMDLVGEARMQVLFWNVYDAQLYAPEGIWSESDPFILSLTYLRDLQGEKIAERSIQEMRKQGYSDERTLARWYEQLAGIIPDVSDQTEIVGFADAKAHTRFYLDGEPIGEIREPGFTRAFFSIWLGEKTSAPQFREQLLGDKS